MQTKPKSNSVVTHEVMGSVITFHVRDAGSFEIDTANLSPGIMVQAALHGIIQKVSDGAAIGRDPETGKPASPADKQARMQAIANGLEKGEWRRKATGERATVGGVLFEALCRAYPKRDRDQLKEWLRGKTKAERAGLENSTALKPYVDAVRAERVGQVDEEKLFEGLED